MNIWRLTKSIFFILLAVFIFMGCSNQNRYKPQMHVVEIKDMKFQPAALLVHKGDTVIWINKDMVAHDITEENKAWASPALPSGVSWKKAITTNESYYCSIHVVMKGRLTIEK
ncbi:MAG: plastocyanin/azurin family copper-binding protein [Sphingobacteriaceae bacterium]